MKKLASFCTATLMLSSVPTIALANDDLRISGFASLVGGTVIDGDGYWARLPEAAGQYESGLEFQTESRLGLQARYQAADKLSLTAQAIFRGINDFEPTLEWLYASYEITPNLEVNAGRMRLPVYHFSDYMAVTYTHLTLPTIYSV